MVYRTEFPSRPGFTTVPTTELSHSEFPSRPRFTTVPTTELSHSEFPSRPRFTTVPTTMQYCTPSHINPLQILTLCIFNDDFKIILPSTGWCRETVKFEIIRKKKTKETYKTLFDLENVFYKSGNFIRHHFLKITSVKCCPFRS
jgi:hypothetical protein